VNKFEGNIQLIWNPSQFDDIQKCEYYYKLRNIDRWGKPRLAATPAGFGTAVHAILSKYDASISNLTLAGFSRQQVWEKAQRIALMDAALEAPKMIDNTDKRRTPEALIRTVIWYTEQYKDDNMTTLLLEGPDGPIPALEVRIPPTPLNDRYYWGGIIDKIGVIDEKNYIVDRKTTTTTVDSSYFVNRFTPDNQITGYMWSLQEGLGIEIAGFIIEAIQLMADSCRIVRFPVPRNPQQIEDWKFNAIKTMERAEYCAKDNYWRDQFPSCSLYGGCEFRGICSVAKSLHNAYLESSFIKRERV